MNKIILKIAITGPESSGKTTLARQLALQYGTVFVPEFARHYLENIEKNYIENDLHNIALGQLLLEKTYLKDANQYLFCDTDFILMKIWSMEKYGRCHHRILEAITTNKYALHLLCSPDLPWEADPLRENPHDRQRLFSLYEKELKHYGFPYVIIKGSEIERLAIANEVLSNIFSNSIA